MSTRTHSKQTHTHTSIQKHENIVKKNRLLKNLKRKTKFVYAFAVIIY